MVNFKILLWKHFRYNRDSYLKGSLIFPEQVKHTFLSVGHFFHKNLHYIYIFLNLLNFDLYLLSNNKYRHLIILNSFLLKKSCYTFWRFRFSNICLLLLCSSFFYALMKNVLFKKIVIYFYLLIQPK